MNRFLLDSNAMNAFINRHVPFSDRLRAARLAGSQIGTCEQVVAEMYYGFEFSATRDQNLARLARGLAEIKCWPFDRRAARECGRLAAELKRRGRIMQTMDVMIASIALGLPNCVVITTDSDFSTIPSLVTANWSVDN
jgi:tRNA(fMet)-specific endonuclease VapC